MNNRVLISGILATILIGCGSGEKGEKKTDTEYYTDNVTKVGVFKDAPVQGLNYQTLTYKGVTDENGHFKYKKGEYITFKLGDAVLGTVKANSVITPYSLVETDVKAARIAYILQNLDIDGIDSNDIIELPTNLNIKSIDLDDENDVVNKVRTLKDNIENSNPAIHLPDVSIQKARANMDNFINNSHYKVEENSIDDGFNKASLVGRSFYVVDDDENDGIYNLDDYITFTETKIINNTKDENYSYYIKDGELFIDNDTKLVLRDIIKNGYISGDVIKFDDVSDGDINQYLVSDKSEAEKLVAYLNNGNNYFSKPIDEKWLVGKTIYVMGLNESATEYGFKGELLFNEAGGLLIYSYSDNKNYTGSYKINSDGSLFWKLDVGDTDYIYIKSPKKNYSYMELNDGKGEITHEYWSFSKLEIENLLKMKNREFKKLNEGKKEINATTLIGKTLYKLDKNLEDITAIKFNKDSLTRYNTDIYNVDSLTTETCSYNYSLTYNDNGILSINGTDCDGDKEEESSKVYEFDLSGQILSDIQIQQTGSELINNKLRDDDIYFVSFTKGKMYCPLLWDYCWFDKDAINRIVEVIK
jgi:hypothetical protein